MKIIIEGSSMLKNRTGIGQFTQRLVRAMAETHPENDYTVFGFKFVTRPLPTEEYIDHNSIKYKFIRLVPGRIYTGAFKNGFKVPIDLMLKTKADIALFPNFVSWPIFSKKTKVITTVHDLSFIHFGQYTSPANREFMTKYVPASIKRSDHIITISESSKQQIHEYFHVDKERISVVTPAIDHKIFFPRAPEEMNTVKKKYKLPEKYIMYMGTIEPRKNIEGLLKSYAALAPKIKADYALVLAGGKGWLDEDIYKTIDALKAKGEKIILTGYVPDEDLPAMYSGASLFVYPSFYEGFGIPPLEAMACGVPVVCSDNSSLPEVAGSACMLVKATDTKAITSSVEKVLSSPSLAKTMRAKGLAQAKKFDWKISGDKLVKIMADVAGAKHDSPYN